MESLAAWMAGDLTSRAFSHTDSQGRNPSDRGYACGRSSGVAENIAAGYNSAQAVFAAWVASPGHNANMLNASYGEVGVARAYWPDSRYGWYWVTTFGAGGGAARATVSPCG